MRVVPTDRGSGFEYSSEIFGGSISQVFLPSIEKGIRQVLETGVIAGFPVVDVKAAVYDGKNILLIQRILPSRLLAASLSKLRCSRRAQCCLSRSTS
jgi:translation elongation factor EF-G